jgi:heterodisulfide reductase subunit C
MSEHTVKINRNSTINEFVEQVESLANQDLLACYQCGKCSAGCPMAKYMDILPNQMIRYAQLGLKEELLSSGAIWMCVSCGTCNSRCPKGVRIAEIIEALRVIQLRTRKDHMDVRELPAGTLASLPPIALIGSMRKFTS